MSGSIHLCRSTLYSTAPTDNHNICDLSSRDAKILDAKHCAADIIKLRTMRCYYNNLKSLYWNKIIAKAIETTAILMEILTDVFTGALATGNGAAVSVGPTTADVTLSSVGSQIQALHFIEFFNPVEK